MERPRPVVDLFAVIVNRRPIAGPFAMTAGGFLAAACSCGRFHRPTGLLEGPAGPTVSKRMIPDSSTKK